MSRFSTWLCLLIGGLLSYFLGGITLNELCAALYFSAGAFFAHWLTNKGAA